MNFELTETETARAEKEKRNIQRSTYSMWSTFRDCRKRYYWRWIEKLEPNYRDPKLALGTLVHQCLESWYYPSDASPDHRREKIAQIIDESTPERDTDPQERKNWHLAHAMMNAYYAQYPREDFQVLSVETEFESPIINPDSDRVSRTFIMAGKIDGLVRRDDGYWIIEHKTTANLNSDYLESIWCDFQIRLYAHFIEQSQGIHVAGIIYNILTKPQIRQGRGETEEEFDIRCQDLMAKSGKQTTTAKRKQDEPDEVFRARLTERLAEPMAFHRVELPYDRATSLPLLRELWELTKSWLDANNREAWYQNTRQCFHWGMKCPYFALCSSNGSQLVRQNDYHYHEPNPELRTPDNGD